MTHFQILFLSFIVVIQIQNVVNLPINESKCNSELNLQKITIAELLQISSPSHEGDVQHEEFMGCVWKRKGLVNEEGVLLVDNFRNVMIKELRTQFPDALAKEKANEAVKYCGYVAGSNPGETSVKMVECLGHWKVQSFIDNERNQKF